MDWRRRRGIFISYRRATSAGYARSIRDHLARQFGDENVFIDVDSIDSGTDFVARIERAIESCRAILVVIDPNWLDVRDDEGRRRLDQPADWVRVEIETVLRRASVDKDHGLKIVPVLVGGADFPDPDDLPPTMRQLANYQGMPLRDTHFDDDLDDVMRGLGKRWRRIRQIAAVTAILLAFAAGIVWLGLRDNTQLVTDDPLDTSPLDSDVNIAVADFTTVDTDGNVVADPDFTLDNDIADELERELAGLNDFDFTFDVRRPAATGTVDGVTMAQRSANAAALAEQLDADMVIYGFVDTDDPSAVTPEFYVTTRNLQDAVELAGPHAVGASIIDVDSSAAAGRRALRLELLSRASSLGDFVAGLVALGADQTDDAARWFESAVESAETWESTAGSQVFHLFLGTSRLRSGDDDGAEASYRRALAIEPDYARAMIGLAEVEFQRSQGNCLRGAADPDGLERSLQMFEEALLAPPSPPEALVGLKVALGSGRAMVCRSMIGAADEYEEGIVRLDQVVATYEAGAGDIREYAALAYGTRAIATIAAALPQPPEADLRSAITDLELAHGLTVRSDVRAPYAGLLGSVHQALGDADAVALWCGRTDGRCPYELTLLTAEVSVIQDEPPGAAPPSTVPDSTVAAPPATAPASASTVPTEPTTPDTQPDGAGSANDDAAAPPTRPSSTSDGQSTPSAPSSGGAPGSDDDLFQPPPSTVPTGPYLTDTDGNGKNDAVVSDADGDGELEITPFNEYDPDGDGTPNVVGIDTDDDGTADDFAADVDGDGQPDLFPSLFPALPATE